MYNIRGGGEDNTANIPPIPPQKPPVNTTETPTTPVVIAETNTTSGLIPSTNPDDRLRKINQGRNDPFNTITPPVVETVSENQMVNTSSSKNRAIIKIPTFVNNNKSFPNTAENSVGRKSFPNNKTINAEKNVVNGKSNKKIKNVSSGNTDFCKIPPIIKDPPIPLRSPEPNIMVSGIVNVNGKNFAIVKFGNDQASRRVEQGEYLSDGNNSVYVKQIGAYNLGPNITLAATPNFTNFSGAGISGGVVFQLEDGTSIVKRVGEKSLAKEKETVNVEPILTKEQFVVNNTPSQGLKLVTVSDVVTSRIMVQNNPEPQTTITVYGTVCNISGSVVRVGELEFSLSQGNNILPPLTAFFEGVSVGDVTKTAQATKVSRQLGKGQETSFSGRIFNVNELKKGEKIIIKLSDWR